MTININFIGCGRLGRTIAKLFTDNSAAIITSICNSSIESSRQAAEFIGAGEAVNNINELLLADFYFITTRDDSIEPICQQLVSSGVLKEGSTVVHCSGSLSSEILRSAKEKNCHIVSVHPIKSFANPGESVHSFPGTYCAVEGDIEAVRQMKELFEKIGAKVFPIQKENKSLYHAAGVMANNYLVTLHYHAVESYKAAGIDESNANQIVSMMMNDALVNVKKLPHKAALTGPIQRGDTGTVKKHMDVLRPEHLRFSIYSKLGLGTLPLTSHSPTIKGDFKKIFDDEEETLVAKVRCKL